MDIKKLECEIRRAIPEFVKVELNFNDYSLCFSRKLGTYPECRVIFRVDKLEDIDNEFVEFVKRAVYGEFEHAFTTKAQEAQK
jgi:radical SAM superfamily enzyme with C-terminal helix-hairpin-helix motif